MVKKCLSIPAFVVCCVLVQNEAYYSENSGNNSQNMDAYRTVPELIRKNGYLSETHIIKTEDGYLLQCHRIPHGKYRNSFTNKPYPMLLVHGNPLSSENWIHDGPGQSLAYLLADDGYDVWMVNVRGNTYSRSHVLLTPTEPQFWNFSFHEIGKYDIPATIDYILNLTKNKKLGYIGYSLGTTIFYVFAVTRPEYSNKVLFHISLANIAGTPHTTSVLRFLIPIAKQFQAMPPEWSIFEHDLYTSFFVKLLCDLPVTLIDYIVCERICLAALFGDDPTQFNRNLLPLFTSNVPAGTSIKNLIHFIQILGSGNLTYYDYGPEGNYRTYGTIKPPSYDVSSISIPIKIYQGKKDIIANTLDTQLFYKKIPKPMGLTFVDYEMWSHLDFVYAVELNKYINGPMLQFIRTITGNPESIDRIVQIAHEERHKTVTPVDVPFNETSFINKYNQFPGFNSWLKLLEKMFGLLSFGSSS